MTTASHVLPAGYQLQSYAIQTVLGQGGFGITYLARDTHLDILVAIKEYLPSAFAVREHDATVVPRSPEHLQNYVWGRERFLDEARLLASFDHPSIVRVHSFLEANNTAYMVMRYEHGASLKHWYRRREFTEDELLDMLHMLMDGVEVLHARNVIHRDIKPDNVYIRSDSHPVLLDFGSARHALGEATRNVTSMVSGGYSAPEQYGTEAAAQGPWTDIYGLAATLYFGMVGRAPPDAMDRAQRLLTAPGDTLPPLADLVGHAYSAELCAAIDHALAVRREDRPQTIAEWRRELPPAPGTHPRWALAPDDEASTRVAATQAAAATQLASAGSAPTAGGTAPTTLTVTLNHRHLVAALVLGIGLIAAAGVATMLFLARDAAPPTAVAAIGAVQDALAAGGQGPAMQILPPGTFLMGAGTLEADAEQDERPQHERVIAQAFAMGTREVTVGEFRKFVEHSGYVTDAERGGGCFHRTTKWQQSAELDWRNPGFTQREDFPVVCVSRADAEAYLAWLSSQTGRAYRLPSEAEWEYAARAGTRTSRWWGDLAQQSCRFANAADRALGVSIGNIAGLECNDGNTYAARTGSFGANAFGLYDMLGNVWEWTADCWRASYLARDDADSCGGAVLRGGSWATRADLLRAANRYEDTRGYRSDIGFRVVADLSGAAPRDE